MAAKGIQFPWWWHGDKISTNLGVIWEMSVIIFKRADHSEPRMWNCRVRVSAERRYLNRATGTVSEQEARSIALEHYWEAKTLAKHGDTVRLWTKPFDKVVELWLKDVKELNEIGLKTDSQIHRHYYGIRGWKAYLNNKPINRISHPMLRTHTLLNNLHT